MMDELSLKVQELFVLVHTDLAALHSEEALEIQDVLRTSPLDAVDNLKGIFKHLCTFKKHWDDSETYQEFEQYQGALQKLEAEVRKRITNEHQLRLALDLSEEKVEALQHKAKNTGKASSLAHLEAQVVKYEQLYAEKAKEAETLAARYNKLKTLMSVKENQAGPRRKHEVMETGKEVVWKSYSRLQKKKRRESTHLKEN